MSHLEKTPIIEPSTLTPKLAWFDWPAMILFAGLMFVVFAQFVTRYLFNDSWAWTEEISRYLLIGVVFAGAVSVCARGEDIALEIGQQAEHELSAKILRVFALFVAWVYYVTLGVGAVLLSFETTQNLVSIAMPKAWIYGFVALTFLFASLLTFSKLFGALRRLRAGSADQYD